MEETSFTKEDAQKLLAENPRCVVIPEGVTSFMSYPFADNATIEEIHLPKSITSIEMAFKNNENLTVIEYSGTLVEWEKIINIYAMLETRAKSVKCADGEWEVPTLHITTNYSGSRVLQKCARFAESVVIPDDVAEIHGNAFSGCKRIKSLTIPASVKTIKSSNFDGHFAFDKMENLEEIEIPATVESFEAKFCGCTSLKTVRMKFTQKEIYGDTFTTRTGKGEVLTCPALETVELPIVQTINSCLHDLPNLKKVIIPDAMGSLEARDIISIPESAEIVVGENAKIAKSVIDEGKTEVYFVKKTGRLLAVRTKELAVALPEGIKIVEPICFPKCIIDLTLPKSIRKIKDNLNFGCSKNVLEYLKNFNIEGTDAAKEKAKKEKIAQVAAVGAGGLAMSELDGLETEIAPVTKPRVGSSVKVKLPYNHEISFFYPKKQKDEEKEALTKLFSILKAAHDDTDSSKLDYLEELFNLPNDVKEKLNCELVKGVLDDDVALCHLQKKLGDTGVKIVLEKGYNSSRFKSSDTIAKFYCGSRFLLIIERSESRYRSTFAIDKDYDDLKNVILTAMKAKSADEIREVESGFTFRIIDNSIWRKGE
jgi:hypothetical protein